jgi:hypothetical protein
MTAPTFVATRSPGYPNTTLPDATLKQACRKALAPEGRYVSIDDGNLELSSRRLEQLAALIQAGTLTPIVGATYPLDSHRRGPPIRRSWSQARRSRGHDPATLTARGDGTVGRVASHLARTHGSRLGDARRGQSPPPSRQRKLGGDAVARANGLMAAGHQPNS